MQQVRLITIFLIVTFSVNAKLSVHKISPENWWTNMENSKVIILAEGEELSGASIKIPHGEIKLIRTIPSQNPNFLLFEIDINKLSRPGSYNIWFQKAGKTRAEVSFLLKSRKKIQRQEITNKDIIYQIVPDRFRDSDISNNNQKNYLERWDKKNPGGIHGGDINGIIQSISYLSNLGITTISLTPVFESNQFFNSYDRFGITDFYKIDKRLGTTTDLEKLVFQAKSYDIKTSLTFVLHQMGKLNTLIKSNPFPDWTVPDFKIYSDQKIDPIFSDPYASETDLQNKYQTWPNMDIAAVNQSNSYLRRYMIQNCIWWIETSGVDAIRIENTHLNTKTTLVELSRTLEKDFPKLTISCDFELASPQQSEFLSQQLIQPNLLVKQEDYFIANTLSNAFSSYIDYNDGISNLYNAFATDYIYEYPQNNITFIDNHKLSRAFSSADKEIDQLKMMLAVLLTTRGIPQITYGTEILVDGIVSGGEGFVRKDMPGISTSDMPNTFTRRGLNSQQQEIHKYLSLLIKARKESTALSDGNTIHFRPEDGMYIYFRKSVDQVVMIIVNNHPQQEKRVETERFSEQLNGYNYATDMITGQSYSDFTNLLITPKSVLILNLK